MAGRRSNLEHWIRRSLADDPPRSKSLIVTIFGDSLLPYVPGLWLSELTRLLHPFHVNAQLVRTSSFRLAEEGWLQSVREGRRSRYSLTASGQQRVEHAYPRIYQRPDPEWDGRWTLVILKGSRSSAEQRASLRRQLEWEGFGTLAPGILLHPRADRDTLGEALQGLNVLQDVVVLCAEDSGELRSRAGTELAEECWNTALVAQRYTHFLQTFEPVVPMLGPDLDPQTAFVVQTLLIHAFRRVVLHDPRLPAALLPAAWPGIAAYDLCRTIYRHTFQQTREYLAEHVEQARLAPLKVSPELRSRFGGLD